MGVAQLVPIGSSRWRRWRLCETGGASPALCGAPGGPSASEEERYEPGTGQGLVCGVSIFGTK